MGVCATGVCAGVCVCVVGVRRPPRRAAGLGSGARGREGGVNAQREDQSEDAPHLARVELWCLAVKNCFVAERGRRRFFGAYE